MNLTPEQAVAAIQAILAHSADCPVWALGEIERIMARVVRHIQC